MLSALEAKVHALEEQLDGEVREKQRISRSVRTLEKRLRDATGLSEETRKQADAFKDQVRLFIVFLFLFEIQLNYYSSIVFLSTG